MDMTNLNGYLVPKMAMKETHRPPVGRIGLQREKFLQENHSLLYDKMLLDGTLYSDLKQTEQRYWEQVEQTITKLLVSNPAPDKNKEMKIIPLQTKDLAQFKAYAKQYGVLFASIKDKSAQGEKIDIMFKAEDVSKLNRIYEQLGYTVPKKISADRKNAETRRQTPDPMLTRGKTMEDIDPRPSFKTVAAQLRKAAARSAERAVNATRKEER